MRLSIILGATAATALATSALSANRTTASRPDFEGIWTNASFTQLERPKELTALVLTPEQARAYEASVAKTGGIRLHNDALGQFDSEFNEAGEGLANIRGQIRSSWIVSPSNGRIPYNAAGKAVWDAEALYDNPEDRPQAERCISSNGSSPPQVPMQDANLLQIVQTPGRLAIVAEKNHDVRLVAIDRARDPRQPASWAGDSVGRWDGDTLVVETQGFRAAVLDRDFFVHSGEARVTERLSRLGPDELLYAFTIVDPKFYSQPVAGEMLFRRAKGPIYEYACHEGNYSLPTILTAARLGRQEKPKTAPTPAGAKVAPP